MKEILEDLNNFLHVVVAMLIWAVAAIVFFTIGLFKGPHEQSRLR